MLIWIRNAAYACVLLALSPVLLIRSLRRRKQLADPSDGSPHPIRTSWRDKLLGSSGAGPTSSRDSSNAEHADARGPRIWLHGVSVGEVQLLRPLTEKLHERYPQASIFVSTTTRTGMQVARKSFSANVTLLYFPFDFSWAIRRTLREVRPDMLVLGELEIWPNLMSICSQQGVRVLIANGRLSDSSFRGYQRFLWLVEPVFSRITYVCAQTQQYADRFVHCGTPPENVVVSGSMKFDNVNFYIHEPRAESFRRLLGLDADARVIVAGSTQVEEETATLAAFTELQASFPHLKLIIVPRHAERFDAAALAVENSRLRWLRRSELPLDASPKPDPAWQVLLVDTLGELSSWWALAEIALVGGTFGSRGGQNMIEPAAFGCNVVFGPRTENFRDVVGQLLAADAAVQLSDASQLTDWLQQQLADPSAGKQRGKNACSLIKQQQGAIAQTVDAIATHLEISD